MSLSTRLEGSVKAGLALLAVAALATSLNQAVHTDEGAANWISYFTNLSNLLGATVLLTGGLALLRATRPVPDLLRGAATLYLVITGAVYWTLLAGTIDAHTIIWANDVVHGVMPAVFLADWIVRPPLRRIPWTRSLPWLAFPLLYLAYSLLRGPSAGWYPYDFLDPRKPGGYGHVAIWSVIITLAFTLVASLLVLYVNARRRSGESGGTGISEHDGRDREMTTA
ncbi:Pr6Pr family membrane protein [Streptomyces sp. NPDC006692]|uniref:Pr6Pr family membrane protein n=1 Tax=Streptomyces sp. NPDC006692 TaxID=3364758 RepID=UPI0036B86E38